MVPAWWSQSAPPEASLLAFFLLESDTVSIASADDTKRNLGISIALGNNVAPTDMVSVMNLVVVRLEGFHPHIACNLIGKTLKLPKDPRRERPSAGSLSAADYGVNGLFCDNK